MTNPETTNPQTEGMFARVFDRIGMLRKHKDDLLNILNTIEPAWGVISKIQHWSVITQTEHILLKKFIEKRWLHTDISSVYDQVTLSCNKEWTLTDLNNFIQLALNYPFILCVDEVREDVASQLEEWMAEIWLNKRRWLVKKDNEGISSLFSSFYWIQWWSLTGLEYEYKKYWLIEVKNYPHGDDNSYNIMFLQKKENNSEFTNIWSYEMLQGFDRDGVWFCMYWWLLYWILHKDTSSETVRIYEILAALKSNWDDIRKWFDSFNIFEAEIEKIWKVTFKKRYDESWKLNWIYAFKKKRFGLEEQVRSRDKPE